MALRGETDVLNNISLPAEPLSWETTFRTDNAMRFPESAEIGYGDYLVVQLLHLVSLPFLHGIWTGISAYFVGLAGINPSARLAIILAGLFGVSALHGLYNTFGDGWFGFVFAMFSLAIFIGYVRSESTVVRPVTQTTSPP